MTKKDYILLAEALRRSRPREDTLTPPDSYEPDHDAIMRGARIAHAQCVANIMVALRGDNARFDEVRFLEAVNK